MLPIKQCLGFHPSAIVVRASDSNDSTVLNHIAVSTTAGTHRSGNNGSSDKANRIVIPRNDANTLAIP